MKKVLLFLFTIVAFGLSAQNVVQPVGITQDMGSDCGDDGGGCGFGIVRANLINGTGLSAEPVLFADLATTTHSRALGDCWATNDESADPAGYFAEFGDVRFTFDLGSSVEVTHVALWGYGYFFGTATEPSTNDPQNMTVEFSNDGGATFGAPETVVASSDAGSGGMSIIIPVTNTTANQVRITITSNYGGGRVGLGEVRFAGNLTLNLPDSPSNLSATETSSSEIDITWNDNSDNETGFILERKEGVGAFVEVATPAANAESYSDSGLNPSTIYTYRITANNGDGDSVSSSEGTAATLATNGNTTVFITPTVITQTQADSEGGLGLSVGDMIDDSGLSATPTVSNVNSILHSGDFTEGNSFVTATETGGGYFSDPANPDPIFELTLDGTYLMSSVVVWGYTLFNLHNAKDITLEFSTDGGSTYAATEFVALNPVPSGTSNATILNFSGIQTANFIRMTFTSSHGGGRVGLGEIKFVGASSVPLSVDSNNLSLYNLYPNPSSDFIHVSGIKENINVKIFNVVGKELRNLELSNSEGIDVSDLSSGLYFVSINNTKALKFIKK